MTKREETDRYHPDPYWSRVAREIRRRGGRNFLAGDETPYFRYKRAKVVDRFLRRIPVEGKSVLEVGCGPGGNLDLLATRSPARLIGVDISEQMIELATENLGHLDRPAELHHINGTTLPFDDRSIDIAYTLTVLMHNTDEGMLRALAGEICRVTSGEVHIIEEVAPTVRGTPLMMRRPVSFYESMMKAHGFRLADSRLLNVFASFAVSNSIIKILEPKGRKEGEPPPGIVSFLQSASLPVTRLLDPLVRIPHGLAHMSFRREPSRQR